MCIALFRRLSLALLPAAALSAALFSPRMQAQDKDWIPTWSPADMALGPAANLPIGKQDVTIRQVVHISQGGKRMRVTLTNEFGTEPLKISAAHIAFLSAGSKILPETDRPLTFGGQATVTIAPGTFLASDAVVETVPIFSDLVISLSVPAQPITKVSGHALAVATTFFVAGDQTTALEFGSPAAVPPGTPAPDLTAPLKAPLGEKPIVPNDPHTQTATAGQAPGLLVSTKSWYFLKNIEVEKTRKSSVVIAFGDSITDGAQSTPDTNRRWPDALSVALAANKKTAALAVVNKGISGNRVLYENAGPSALDRWDRDVLREPGARYVLIVEGINDIGNMHRAPADAITEQQLIGGFTALATRAHAKGLKIIAGTILPYEGAKYYSEDGEKIRADVNAFLRTSKLFDGVVDFDKATQDPQRPGHMLAKYDCGDHLHPSDAGYAAMAAAINVKLFKK
jgi:lysophospholipase L1-like esterase